MFDYKTAIQRNYVAAFPNNRFIDYDFFTKSFTLLENKGEFEELFKNMSTAKQVKQLKSFATEFNLAAQIVLQHKDVDIKYEEEKTEKKANPDFKIRIDGQTYIIQVKTMEESVDYKRERSKYPNGFVCVNDITQIREALTKAGRGIEPVKGVVFLIAQEIKAEINADFISQSEALFGREQYVCQGKKRNITRDKGGFFFSETGQLFSGYIDLQPEGRGLFYNYKMTLFLSKKYEQLEADIKKLLNFEEVYRFEDLPN